MKSLSFQSADTDTDTQRVTDVTDHCQHGIIADISGT